ncbi:MAG: hypothetical protein IJ172_11330 [Ruminococcus sp.]|nr:hypothetical protein [Ruminococcus sp.]
MTLKEQLNEIISRYDLIDVTFDSFWRVYNCYLAESAQEASEYGLFDEDSVNVSLRSESYVISETIKSNGEKNEFIEIRIEMRDKQDHYIGYYDAVFDLDGTFADDFFVLE